MNEVDSLDYEMIRYLFTAVGFPYRIFVGKYE
jgi:hypothetical protein